MPGEKVLGADVGRMFQQLHEAGVTFKLGCKATAMKGDKQVEAVILDSGESLPADRVVVVSIGVQPATDFIEQIALNEDDNSVPVNQYLQAIAETMLPASHFPSELPYSLSQILERGFLPE